MIYSMTKSATSFIVLGVSRHFLSAEVYFPGLKYLSGVNDL